MDALSRMLLDAQVKSRLKGIRASKEGPRINHLFFADDALLFVRNNRKEEQECMKILATFERMSGQKVNYDKSMVCFSPKTPIPHRVAANEIFKMKVTDELDKYLGLPIPIGKKKAAAFKSIIDRTAKRINSWSKRLLSSAGKEIFIKAVIQSLPTYAFSVFLAPKGVIDSIQTMIGRVWWGSKENNRIGLGEVMLPKGYGGLGFRDLYLFNIALLGRQVLCLLTCKGTLCYEVLSAKYFPNGDIFHAKNVDKPSFTWKSISKAAEKLKEGFGWNVGSGMSIDIWRDRWGVEGLSGSSIRVDKRLVPEVHVAELFGTNRNGWNKAEKEGGRRKPKTPMREFNEFMEELSLVDIKTRGSGLVKERLDRVLVTEDVIEDMPFLETRVVRQSNMNKELENEFTDA
ncbi:reverse transcriptase [Gossypium australe]|uniref:Reverse transcriptase n=1 Tax=Gossypium australe TaxID=47621 RepID=A0A5B6WS80_9ROSI|nr:reverse transcriptase [Gossypium australe]